MKHESETDGCDNPALAWARRTGMAEEVFVGVHRRVRRRRLGIAGASLLIGALAAITFRETPGEMMAMPATAVVMLPAKQTLPDGTTVELKDGASIDVEFGAAARRVTLASGEAHFQVAKDSARPFVVIASGVEVRAVGTAFSVQLSQRTLDVLVTEGVVEFDKAGILEARSGAEPASSPKPLAIVAAGNRVTVDISDPSILPAPPVVAVSETEIAQRLSWRVERLRFSGTPLVEAIPLFNRHSSLQLVIGDPEVGRLKLSGTLRADDPESLVQLLHVEFGIKAEPRGEFEITLRR